MYLIVTRSFPPELGGMQNLMWGLSRELSKNFMIKVFADHIEVIKNLMSKPLFRSKELEELNYLENIEKHN